MHLTMACKSLIIMYLWEFLQFKPLVEKPTWSSRAGPRAAACEAIQTLVTITALVLPVTLRMANMPGKPNG